MSALTPKADLPRGDHFLILERVKKDRLAACLLGTSGRPVTLIIMTYENDLNTNRRSDMHDDARYTTWIIGGVVTLAILIAAAAFISTGNNRDLDLPQITTTIPAPAPSTTGSDTAR
jgi:hypothetical protein